MCIRDRSYSGRIIVQANLRGRFDYGQKSFFWLMFLWRDPAADFGRRALVCRVHPLEPVLAVLSVRHGTRYGGAGDDRRVHHSRLHGHGDGPVSYTHLFGA